MNIKKSLFINSIAFGVLAVSAPAANAQFYVDYLRNFTHRGSAGNFYQINNNIQAGINQIRNQINSGVASGRLSPAEAHHFNVHLANLIARHNHFSADGVYTNAEVQSMLLEFSTINNTLASALNDGVYGGIAAYPGYYDGYYPFTDYNSVINFQNQLWSQINAANVAAAQRAAWLNEYRILQNRLARQNLRATYRNNNDLRQLVKLQQKIIRQQQLATPGHRKWR
ncbi:MAG TPA: hypothetical protein V6D17_22990 [Candidatus Obscuribacterales bacterium]